ncbi:hypothetical protein HZH68_001549 [Vespula germanica]|uniref:Uncharacterized protein n=1 Tax=Vespula germanica TaxID=30212 RepID=A0A834NVW9_VESGE|nr:hypothetical protein HZH68_001549 [Vespula germanica]
MADTKEEAAHGMAFRWAFRWAFPSRARAYASGYGSTTQPSRESRHVESSLGDMTAAAFHESEGLFDRWSTPKSRLNVHPTLIQQTSNKNIKAVQSFWFERKGTTSKEKNAPKLSPSSEGRFTQKRVSRTVSTKVEGKQEGGGGGRDRRERYRRERYRRERDRREREKDGVPGKFADLQIEHFC